MKENFKNPIGQQNNTAKNFFTIYSWRLKVIKKEATAMKTVETYFQFHFWLSFFNLGLNKKRVSYFVALE